MFHLFIAGMPVPQPIRTYNGFTYCAYCSTYWISCWVQITLGMWSLGSQWREENDTWRKVSVSMGWLLLWRVDSVWLGTSEKSCKTIPLRRQKLEHLSTHLCLLMESFSGVITSLAPQKCHWFWNRCLNSSLKQVERDSWYMWRNCLW